MKAMKEELSSIILLCHKEEDSLGKFFFVFDLRFLLVCHSSVDDVNEVIHSHA